MKFPTRKQSEALLRVYNRAELWMRNEGMTTSDRHFGRGDPLTYLQFRRKAKFASAGILVVPWCGMYLGIEPNGYCHS